MFKIKHSEPSYIDDGNVNWLSHFRTVWQFFKKLKLAFDSEISLLHIHPRELKVFTCKFVHRLFIVLFIVAKKNNTQMLNKLMNKQIVAYPYNGIFGH